jgi:HAD superfamily hydrolase (TIGR01509 family)
MIVEALVFDFDGLILDTEWPEFFTVREEFANHGVVLELEAWQQIVGRADHPHWFDWLETEVGATLERDTIVERRRSRHHAMIAGQQIRPGVTALLDDAAAHGVPVGVASSSTQEWVEGHLERLGLLDRFAVIRCRDHVARAKPDPDLFRAAMDALGVTPARSVALEDSHHGCASAKAAGLLCVVVPNEVTRTQSFDHADLVVESLTEVSLASLSTLLAARGDRRRRLSR